MESRAPRAGRTRTAYAAWTTPHTPRGVRATPGTSCASVAGGAGSAYALGSETRSGAADRTAVASWRGCNDSDFCAPFCDYAVH